MHPVLLRQLRKLGLSGAAPPSPDAWARLLTVVDASYVAADEDRYTLERSIEISGLEMHGLHDSLRAERDVLREHSARLWALVENLQGGNLMESEERRILYANAMFCRLFGIRSPPEAMIGSDCVSALKAAAGLFVDPDGFVARVEQTLRRREVVTNERFPLLDGRVFERDYFPIFHGASYAGHLWQYRDVTERLKLQERLLIADRMGSMGTLAAGVAHEINNPLAYTMANLTFAREQVARGGEPEEILEALREAEEGAERVRQIVRGLKSFSRADEATRVRVEVVPVLESSINLAWGEIRHRARLVREFGPVPAVLANEGRLGQVFVNLLVNAAQAIPEGAVRDNEIVVSTGVRPSGAAVVAIRDTGVGIAPASLARIFDPFFTTKPVGLGTGLGLSICYHIVDELGGKIDVHSREGVGTTFEVELPAAPAALPGREPAPTNEASPVGVRPRVLIVDDETKLGRAMARMIESDFSATVVSSGRAALAFLERGEVVDLVLADLMMPDITGMDLYERCLETVPSMASRFVFVTGGVFSDRARDFVARLAAPCLEKPVMPGELRRTLLDRFEALKRET